jgi:transmembrane sensor
MKNEMDHTAIDILLAAYFAGEADAADCAKVEAWCAASEENRNYFRNSENAWNALGAAGSDVQFDTDAAWKNLKQKIKTQKNQNPETKSKYTWAAAAGVILIIAVASLFWLTRDHTDPIRTLAISTTGEVINDTLPDGTVVSLNKNSELVYPSVFADAERNVTLKGEAFFDVSHDAAHPFIIHAGMLDVKVLGTSFNVLAYPAGDSVHVSVYSGKVQCMSGNDTIVIMPGECAVYHKGEAAIVRGEEDDPNRTAYRNRIFRFEDTPLGVAVQQLNDAYGCNIILKNDALKTCTFTITKVFNNEPVGNIIEAIEAIYPDITSHTEGNTITLDGSGCN